MLRGANFGFSLGRMILPVLSPGNKTKTGKLWTYIRDDRPAGEDTAPAAWSAYSEDRKGEQPLIEAVVLP